MLASWLPARQAVLVSMGESLVYQELRLPQRYVRIAVARFGPSAPAGKEKNWIQTVPGKGWFTYIRLYGPLEPFFDQTWKPDDIVRVG